jgi:phosphatidate cytidylyltransferase
MLWKRVATAVVLLPLLLLALFKLPATGIAVVIAVAVMIATWEMAALIGFDRLWQRLAYVGGIGVAGVSGSIGLLEGGNVMPPVLVAGLWWFYATIHIAREDGSFGGVFGSKFGRMIAGIVIMLPCWLAFLYLFVVDSAAPRLLLYVLVLVWIADSFAYFTGRAWGKHKLAPSVSPGKSVEGVLGGLAGVAVVALMGGYYLWDLSGQVLILWLVVSLVTGAISVVGDLTESIFKRRAGVKDSGQLLPGHGGMFDRIDALTAAIPVFALGWMMLLKAAV